MSDVEVVDRDQQDGLPGEVYPMPSDQQDETCGHWNNAFEDDACHLPKGHTGFHCYLGFDNCTHGDQQDEQACGVCGSVIEPNGIDQYHDRALHRARAEGERAATERIIRYMESVGKDGYVPGIIASIKRQYRELCEIREGRA